MGGQEFAPFGWWESMGGDFISYFLYESDLTAAFPLSFKRKDRGLLAGCCPRISNMFVCTFSCVQSGLYRSNKCTVKSLFVI